MVEPKRKKLAEAEAQLQAANSQLREKQDALAAVVQRVNNLKKQLADAESEQRQLTAQVCGLLTALLWHSQSILCSPHNNSLARNSLLWRLWCGDTDSNPSCAGGADAQAVGACQQADQRPQRRGRALAGNGRTAADTDKAAGWGRVYQRSMHRPLRGLHWQLQVRRTTAGREFAAAT